MSAIAREAGISKALLYHYFPSKQAYFVATLRDAAAELAERVRPDPGAPPAAQLSSALDAWLDWVDAHRDAYARLMRGAAAAPELRELIDRVRDETSAIILGRLWPQEPPAPLRAAVRGWLWLMDGVCLDWVERNELERRQLHALLSAALPGLVAASGCPEVLDGFAAAAPTTA
jgi:AcrR family transcriptional regulator